MKPQDNEHINLKKLIEAIDMRFVSGNNVPVERAHIRVNEWAEIHKILVANCK